MNQILLMRCHWCLSKTFPPYVLTQGEKFNKETQKQQKIARRQTSLSEVKQAVSCVQELYALIRVEERDDQPGLHAVRDSLVDEHMPDDRIHEDKKCIGKWID